VTDTPGYLDQLPDSDPTETREWLDAFDAVAATAGPARARQLLARLGVHARATGLHLAHRVSTPYLNTIPPDAQPWCPGDEAIERRIRRLVRWNAVAMVVRANRAEAGLGGHLSTFASSAALYEVGMNWFFRGKEDGLAGDAVYFQGHAAPGIYARSFLEGRLTADDLDAFRRETSAQAGRGLPSYPHPRLMPDFWEYPTVSMGLGPLTSIYHARFLRYLANRNLDDTTGSRVWCFLGDGETDEPETLGAIALAARESLDNLTWVVNCNLQRLDGPVRGNGKIIQELEAVFRGAGWNVIKVVWGTGWDPLLAADVDGVLVDKMNATPDGDFQRYAVSDGAHIRDHFFGPDPRLRAMVAHLSDDELRRLPRGGHDYAKLYAAYTAAVATTGVPTVILAKTVKGWTLGPSVEGRNATHQVKQMTADQMVELAHTLHLADDLDMDAVAAGEVPYLHPGDDAPEIAYLKARRRALDGPLPSRPLPVARPLTQAGADCYTEFDAGSHGSAVSTTGAFTRLLRSLLRDPDMGERVVPIVADEARTFGMDALFREFGIYAHAGQRYQPVDHELLISYREHRGGQLLEEGITEAGATASWLAAGCAHATRGLPMLPFYTFYSMFGFQRVGDLLWAAADAGARGFLVGATAGRTTLAGEGLQHADGHSPLLASVIPTCRVYDPAFAYELAAIVRRGIDRMYGTAAGGGPAGGGPVGDGGEVGGVDEFYYLTAYNEPWEQPARPTGVTDDDILAGMYLFRPAPDLGDDAPRASLLFSGAAWAAAWAARDLLADRGVAAELWSVPGWKQLREDGLDAERRRRLGDDTQPALVARMLAGGTGPVVAVTDYLCAVPDQIARFVPAGRRWASLGTDGFGRSDARAALRKFFEVDAAHVELAVLAELAADGRLPQSVVADAARAHHLTPDSLPPRLR
jgi:pyruvate dehydrogenase E1 component